MREEEQVRLLAFCKRMTKGLEASMYDQIQCLVDAAVAAEREECAATVEMHCTSPWKDIALAIRRRRDL